MGDAQGALDEAQRGMAVNPGFAQLYVIGTAAAWRLGAEAHTQAHGWVKLLRDHKAFSSVAAVRASQQPLYDPAALGQFEALIGLLREAGLPAD